MPRINIEDELWIDPRYEVLKRVLSDDEAIGVLVRFWKCAQSFWRQDQALIPNDIFEMFEFPEALFKCQLAERRETGVYAKGSAKHFAWLLQKIAAGKKSGEVRAQSSTHSVVEQKQEVDLNGSGTARERRVNGGEPQSQSQSQSPNQSKDKEEYTALFPVPEISEAPDTLPKIAMLWNDHASAVCPRVKSMDKKSTRYKACSVRWKEKPDERYWTAVIHRMNSSDFCTGKTKSPWVADIEFLTRPDTHNKILEGKYDNRTSSLPSPQLFKTATERKHERMREMAAKYLTPKDLQPPQGDPTDGDL